MKKFFLNIDLGIISMFVFAVCGIVFMLALFIPGEVASYYHWHSSPVRDTVNNICGWILACDFIFVDIYMVIAFIVYRWQEKAKEAEMMKAQAKKAQTESEEVSDNVNHLINAVNVACSVIADELHEFTPNKNRILGACAQLNNIDDIYNRIYNTVGCNLAEINAYNVARTKLSAYTGNIYVQSLYNKVYGVNAVCF